MRGLSDAKVEIGLATMAYNLKPITNVLGTVKLTSNPAGVDYEIGSTLG
jgi:hypothetical protein